MFIGMATTLGAVGTQWMIRNGLNILLPSPSIGSHGVALGQVETDLCPPCPYLYIFIVMTYLGEL